MRLARYLLLPAALAFLFGGAETALTCCGPDFVKLPTPVPSGIIRGNQFFAVTADGKLLAADVTDHKVKQFPDLAKLGPMLDARGDTVCVTAGQKLLLVCVSTGKVCRELQIDGVIRSFGFAGDNHLFVHRGKALDLIDLKTGRATAVIESGKYGSYGRYGQYGQYGQVAAVERLAPGAIADPSGKQIYALVSGERTGLAVVDVATAKVTAIHPINADTVFRRSHLQVAGCKVFYVNSVEEYGEWQRDQLGCVDLKTGKHESLKLPGGMETRGTISAGPGDSIFLTTKICGATGNATFRYDADGKLVGQVRLLGPGTLAGFWGGDAVTLAKDRVFIDVPVIPVPSK